MAEVSVRDLRNHTADVMRRVQAGEKLTLTVNRRPVADIVPHEGRSTSISRERFMRILEETPLDEDLLRDVDEALPQTIDEL